MTKTYNPPEFSAEAAADLAALVAAGPAGSVAAGTGIGVSTVGGVATVSNTGVLSLTGTARVHVSAATGAVTIDTLGATAGPFTTVSSITVVDGIVTAPTGS